MVPETLSVVRPLFREVLTPQPALFVAPPAPPTPVFVPPLLAELAVPPDVWPPIASAAPPLFALPVATVLLPPEMLGLAPPALALTPPALALTPPALPPALAPEPAPAGVSRLPPSELQATAMAIALTITAHALVYEVFVIFITASAPLRNRSSRARRARGRPPGEAEGGSRVRPIPQCTDPAMPRKGLECPPPVELGAPAHEQASERLSF